MNSRSVPWRKKPTSEIQSTFEDASQLKLYLLQEIGPTSFVFKDESENKFKVSIGHEISCSCSPTRKDHCIHTLYVCLKIFKLERENPLAWQASYIDSEIADLIRFRFNPSAGNKPKKIENFLKKSTNPLAQPKEKSKNQRQALGEDDMCPICHENLSEEEGTTFCKKACGNNFHIKCSLIWAEHRHKIGDTISCPMCRCDWGPRAYDTLVKEFQDFESRLILHKGHKCGACKGTKAKSVRGKLFKCVHCENFELCEKCFQNFEHFEHHRYLVKENINAQWKPAQNRDKSLINPHAKNSLDVFNEIMGHGNFNNPYNINNQMLGNRFHRLGEVPIEGDTSENFILSCFPDLDSGLDIVPGRPNNLSIVGHDVKKNCSCCHTDKTDVSRIKRLNCGHVMHGHCMLEMITNKNFKCPDDHIEFLKGYKNAIFPKENVSNTHNANNTAEKPQQQNQQQQQKIGQNSTKPPKKAPFEEQKSNRNNIKLGPLELDIKGKGVSGSTSDTGPFIENETLFKPKSIISKNAMKKPPAHSKSGIKANSRDITLPPLFEIQGTNLTTEQPSKSLGNVNTAGNAGKKPLMPIQQNSANNFSDRGSPLGGLSGNNFRIVPNSMKVQQRKTRKALNAAGLKSVQRNNTKEEELNLMISNTMEKRYAGSVGDVGENRTFEDNGMNFEEVSNENY